MPAVSIIIPLYNQDKFVGEAIQSAFNQTYYDYEVIVVDDGSTDNGREVVSRFGERVRYIYQENQGLAGARNTAILAAKGDLVGLLDADDQWFPDYLETMVSLADQNPEAAVFFCAAQSMDEAGKDLPEIFGKPPSSSPDIYRALLRADFLIPSTILMRRSIVLSAGLFDQTLRLCEDWDLWLRILPNYKFIGTSRCLIKYRLHSRSLSNKPTGNQITAKNIVEKYFGPDDGHQESWSTEKRRAYGGVYRYHVLTSVQYQNEWEKAGEYLNKALAADPTLSTDLDLFYELAYGFRSPGYRGSSHPINLEDNALHLQEILSKVFCAPDHETEKHLLRKTYGTAYYALGLVAYQASKMSLSRRYFSQALYYRPELFQDRRLLGNSIKSLLGRSVLNWMKQIKVQSRA